MDLYKRTGTNPFSSCLPILLQSPFFFALFRVLNNLHGASPTGTHAADRPDHPVRSRRRPSSPRSSAPSCPRLVHGLRPTLNVKIVTVVLIVLMSATTFTTQRQLMTKNMPASALDNPFAKQQKMLLYLMPLFFAISGINFPIGVLLYWLTTNLWSMGQQFYVIRRMPAPGSQAEKALEERRMKSGKAHKKFTIPGLHHEDRPRTCRTRSDGARQAGPGQRQQPKRKKRNRPAPPTGTKPAAKPAPSRARRPRQAATHRRRHARPQAGTPEPAAAPADRAAAMPPHRRGDAAAATRSVPTAGSGTPHPRRRS